MITFIFAHLLALEAFANGPEAGNGGGSFACMSETGEVFTAEIQDLWEAQNVWGLNLPQLAGTEIEQSFAMISRIETPHPKLYRKVYDALSDILERREILPVSIEEVGDSNHKFSKDYCPQGMPKFVQAAIYLNSNRIVYSQRIWEKLSDTHKASLNVHEAIYKVFRSYYGDTTSEHSRKIVSYLFSSVSPEILSTIIPAYRFNPNGPLSYDEKVADLLLRFNDGTAPSFPVRPEPSFWGPSDRKIVYRTCDEFIISDDVVPRKIPKTKYAFLYHYEGKIRAVDYDAISLRRINHLECWLNFDNSYKDSYIFFNNNRSFSFGEPDVKLTSDENNDWIMMWYGLDEEKCIKRDWLGIRSKWEYRLKKISFCPNQE